MKLEYVGFAELSIPGPLSLVDAPRERRSAEELRQILGYLGDGHLLAASGAVADVLDRSRQRVVAAEVRTDGVWVWPNEITYYVANYGVAVPERFVAHARTSGWSVPPL
ncbi:MAG: hypothetical protein ABMB14_38830, partial [Myxococcota bacterium]